jgi:uncharacterized protein (DUF2147 family)
MNKGVHMKKLILSVFTALVVGTPLFADPIFGTWQTVPDDNGNYGYIEVKNCGGTICGTLGKSFDSAGKSVKSEHQGKKIIWDMKPNGGGKYSGGKIWSPDRDKVYKSKLELVDNNSLKVSGCIAFICRDGGTWKRIK